MDLVTRKHVVTEAHDETVCVRSFLLQPQDGSTPDSFHPGQFVVVRFPGKDRFSAYSLSGCPGKAYLRITIKRADPVQAEVGSVVDVGEPMGDFRLDLTGGRPIFLLSAGVGVTPIMSMLEHAVATSPNLPITFVYCTRNSSSHVFRDRMCELARTAPQVRLHVAYSQPDRWDRPGVDFHSSGRVNFVLLRQLGLDRKSDYYICGPSGFLDALLPTLIKNGIPHEQIHVDTSHAPVASSVAEAAGVELPRGIETGQLVDF